MVVCWDDYFMTMVYLVASKSKDDRTKIGAIIVGTNKEIRSTGYNGFVRGLDDTNLERHKKGEKQYWFEHAERNAIYNATLIGTSLSNCIMYTQGIPCMDCARGIIQSGIKEVVIDEKWITNYSRDFVERDQRSMEIFKETGVTLRKYNPSYVNIEKINDGIVYLLE